MIFKQSLLYFQTLYFIYSLNLNQSTNSKLLFIQLYPVQKQVKSKVNKAYLKAKKK